MEMPEEPPPAEPGEPGEPKASRLTTIVLIVSLVVFVLIAGVLGTVAVLMTKSPDSPFLGAVPPQRLATPIHFAPVRETKPAPCPGVTAVLDKEQTTCYLLEDGVTVNAVQRIEAVREKDGTYSVRIAIAPAFKQKVSDLIDELVTDQRQVAVVLVPKTVLAAPIVTQPMDGDSLSIAGFGKEEAEALTASLLSTSPTAGAPADGTPTGGAPTNGAPTGGAPTGGAPTGGAPTSDPAGTVPNTGTTSTGAPNTGSTTTGAPNAGAPTSTSSATDGRATSPVRGTQRPLDTRYASCKEAVAAGDGPYYKGRHPEYAWYTDVDKNGVACNTADIR
ncbi:excalibur calcium-binding domain-containing protein [Nonomuraea sp. NEAU-A123]|uniref:excalibur calcium-binding domain-containing protein n=1 Tax=Nonomuraea sp. NEAU-A123 TaxID=2839649 RepID=UPI001BE40CA2|nr:excalibur calcium-binding domain-containing protein [Nonomuraea sp. NEAU-A123]MBT2229108.1 excalibur calcium-binding domain-containing protein [Nonomuraea sp. NEAU-A123]